VKHLSHAVAFGLVLASNVSLAQNRKPATAEQSSFCEGEAPDNLQLQTTVLPRKVVAKVMDTVQGRDAKELADNEGKELDPTKILKGMKIKLSDSRGSFFIVMGSYPMSGADNTWFWIVRDEGQKTDILLFAGGNCLDLSTKETLGYRDVVTTWSSPSETTTTTYAYDGEEYQAQRRSSRPNERR
jgi:hypothetical protein